MYDDIEITTTTRIRNNDEFPTKIYEYEENVEVLITNSKPKEERRSKTEIQFYY